MTPDFEFEQKVKRAIFRVHWDDDSTTQIRIMVSVDGKNTLPPAVKDRYRDVGFIPLDIGKTMAKNTTVQWDEKGLTVYGLSFDRVTWDIEIPWLDIVAIGRLPGPFFGFSRSSRETPEAPKHTGDPAKVVNLADRRRVKNDTGLN